jgi:hypothetical protein
VSSHLLNETEASGARPIWLVGEHGFGAWLEVQPPAVRSWVRSQGFQAEKNKLYWSPPVQVTALPARCSAWVPRI